MVEPSAPRTIGRYNIIGTLGRGSMGMVYKGQDPEIGRIVAIKVLRTVYSAPGALDRFLIEARSAGNLRHPHIITVFEVNRENETPYIVMEWIDGEGLDAVIKRRGKLDPPQMLHYVGQVASGLDYAHSKNVVHCDIKPANVLIDRVDNVFILDFGVAHILGSASKPGEPVMGTPGYMAPEQILNEPLDSRADLFSLAIIAFECLTGRRPFPGDDFTTVIGNILAGRRLSLQEAGPSLPLSLEAVFERALSKDREQRYRTGHELVSALQDALRLRTERLSSASSREPSAAPQAAGKAPSQQDVMKAMMRTARTKARLRSLAILGGVSSVVCGIFLLVVIGRQGAPTGPLNPPAVVPSPSAEPAPTAESAPTPIELGEVIPTQPPDIDSEIRRALEEHRHDASRVVAVLQRARGHGMKGLTPLLIPLIHHDSYLVRYETATLLGTMQGDQVVVRGLTYLLDDRDPVVREAAAKALGALGDRDGLRSLAPAAIRETDPRVVHAIHRSIEILRKRPASEEG